MQRRASRDAHVLFQKGLRACDRETGSPEGLARYVVSAVRGQHRSFLHATTRQVSAGCGASRAFQARRSIQITTHMNISATTWTAFMGGLTSLLALLSTLSVQFAEINAYIPERWRIRIAITSAIASAILKWINGALTPDKKDVKP